MSATTHMQLAGDVGWCNHKAALSMLSICSCMHRADSGSHLFCETCNVSATSDVQLAAHLSGKNHKRHTSLAELSSRGAAVPAGQEGDATLFCDICDVKAPSAHHKEYHLRYGPDLASGSPVGHSGWGFHGSSHNPILGVGSGFETVARHKGDSSDGT